MKIVDYIFNRLWIIILIIVAVVLYLHVRTLNVINADDFLIEIADHNLVAGEIALTSLTDQRKLVPNGFIVNEELEIDEITVTFMITWQPRSRAANAIEVRINASVIRVLLVSNVVEDVTSEGLIISEMANDQIQRVKALEPTLVFVNLKMRHLNDEAEYLRLQGKDMRLEFGFEIRLV